MADKTNFNGVVDSLLNGMDGFLSSKTVVGEATHIDDTIIVPLVDVSVSAQEAQTERSPAADAAVWEQSFLLPQCLSSMKDAPNL